MARRLLIVEEALKDYVGHWYEYVRAVADLNRAAGVEVHVAGHVSATGALREELGVEPLFERSPWDGDYRNEPWPWRKLGLLRHNFLVLRRMLEFLRSRPRFDCLFAPTVVLHHVWGWRLLWTMRRQRIGRLVLLVRNNVADYADGGTAPRFGLKARLFGLGIRSFAGHVAAGRVVFATDSDRLAEEYRQLAGIDFAVFPSPRVAPPATARTPRGAGAPLLFACLGPARFEKGIDILQEAIAIHLASPAAGRAQFVIQWPNAIADAAGASYLPDTALARSGQVEFLTEPLDSEAYDALLARTDVMVLPYRRSSYFARISGVAVEAVTAGIPVIATADTWTSDLVERQGAGLAVPDGDPRALADAIAAISAEYPRFREQADTAREAALRANAGDRFMEQLWGDGAG